MTPNNDIVVDEVRVTDRRLHAAATRQAHIIRAAVSRSRPSPPAPINQFIANFHHPTTLVSVTEQQRPAGRTDGQRGKINYASRAGARGGNQLTNERQKSRLFVTEVRSISFLRHSVPFVSRHQPHVNDSKRIPFGRSEKCIFYIRFFLTMLCNGATRPSVCLSVRPIWVQSIKNGRS